MKILIVGGGIGGFTLVMVKQHGIQVQVIERVEALKGITIRG